MFRNSGGRGAGAYLGRERRGRTCRDVSIFQVMVANALPELVEVKSGG